MGSTRFAPDRFVLDYTLISRIEWSHFIEFFTAGKFTAIFRKVDLDGAISHTPHAQGSRAIAVASDWRLCKCAQASCNS